MDSWILEEFMSSLTQIVCYIYVMVLVSPSSVTCLQIVSHICLQILDGQYWLLDCEDGFKLLELQHGFNRFQFSSDILLLLLLLLLLFMVLSLL
jgi:hypothetical protein